MTFIINKIYNYLKYNRLKMQREVDYHENIIKFHGISKLENKYLLVMEYADGGRKFR